MATLAEEARIKQLYLIDSLQEMGFTAKYARKVSRHIDPLHPEPLELAFEWIERHPPKPSKDKNKEKKKKPKVWGVFSNVEQKDFEEQTKYLASMGFSKRETMDALARCGNQIDAAVVYLLNNRMESSVQNKPTKMTKTKMMKPNKQKNNLDPKRLTLTRSLQQAELKSMMLNVLLGSEVNVESENLKIKKNVPKGIRFSEVITPEPMNDDETSEERICRLRRTILMEILGTEEKYVMSLKELLSKFLIPIQKNNLLSNEELSNLFSNIEQIVRLNEKFLNDLEERLIPSNAPHIVVWDQQLKEHLDKCQISDLLMSYAAFFKIYISYSNNYHNASKVLQELRNGNLKNAQKITTICDLTQLQNLLIIPIQRIPRYALLIEQLLKRTKNDDPEHLLLETALLKMKSTAASMNKSRAREEEMEAVLRIQQQFSDNAVFVTPQGRKFLGEGIINEVTKKGNRKQVYAFCFDDLLVLADRTLGPSGWKYSVRQLLPLEASCRLESDHTNIISNNSSHERAKTELNLNFNQLNLRLGAAKSAADLSPPKNDEFRLWANDGKLYIFHAVNQDDKERWVNMLKQCIDKNIREEELKAANSMNVTFRASNRDLYNAINACHCCGKALALMKRRICQHCKRVVCNRCSQARMKLEDGVGPKRICSRCVPDLKLEATVRLDGTLCM